MFIICFPSLLTHKPGQPVTNIPSGYRLFPLAITLQPPLSMVPHTTLTSFITSELLSKPVLPLDSFKQISKKHLSLKEYRNESLHISRLPGAGKPAHRGTIQ